MNLEAVDLLRRAKELDAREEALAKKENLFQDAVKETDITVLEEIHKVKQQQVVTAQKKLATLKDKYDLQVINYKQSLRLFETQIELLKGKVKLEAEKLVEIDMATSNSSKSLATTKAEIIEQRRYYKEQENITQDTISGWNIELQQFSKAVSDEYDKKVALLRENNVLIETNAEMRKKNEHVQNDLVLLEEKFEQRSSELREDLRAV